MLKNMYKSEEAEKRVALAKKIGDRVRAGEHSDELKHIIEQQTRKTYVVQRFKPIKEDEFFAAITLPRERWGQPGNILLQSVNGVAVKVKEY